MNLDARNAVQPVAFPSGSYGFIRFSAIVGTHKCSETLAFLLVPLGFIGISVILGARKCIETLAFP